MGSCSPSLWRRFQRCTLSRGKVDFGRWLTPGFPPVSHRECTLWDPGSVSLVFVSVFREAYQRPDQADRGGASLRAPGPAAERGPDEAQQRACAPRRRARRGEPTCALASAVASDEDWTRERSCALCTRFAPAEVSAYASPSPRRVATSVGYHPPVSLEGGTDPLGTCSRPMGGGTINRGGTLNRT